MFQQTKLRANSDEHFIPSKSQADRPPNQKTDKLKTQVQGLSRQYKFLYIDYLVYKKVSHTIFKRFMVSEVGS